MISIQQYRISIGKFPNKRGHSSICPETMRGGNNLWKWDPKLLFLLCVLICTVNIYTEKRKNPSGGHFDTWGGPKKVENIKIKKKITKYKRRKKL